MVIGSSWKVILSNEPFNGLKLSGAGTLAVTLPEHRFYRSLWRDYEQATCLTVLSVFHVSALNGAKRIWENQQLQ